MAILTWEQYSSLHNIITENEFAAAEAKAEASVRSVVGAVRWANITEDTPFYDVLQECIANVIDYQATTKRIGQGITSVSNDGYTESYAVTSASAAANELRSNIITWLSGTGFIGAY